MLLNPITSRSFSGPIVLLLASYWYAAATVEVLKTFSVPTSSTPIDYPKFYSGNERTASSVQTLINHNDVHSNETADTDADAPTSLRLRGGHGSTRASDSTTSNITATSTSTATQPSPYPHPQKTLSTLNKSSQLQESSIDPIDICFVSSIFGPETKTADRPNDFTNFHMDNITSFRFFLYTNLEDLESPGWTKVLRNFGYRRYITQSRWGKFMAWKDPEMKDCQTIFYFDGHYMPSGKSRRFANLAKYIKQSKFGLSQKLHPEKPKRSAISEFGQILKQKKDIKANVDASIAWLQAQPDFYDNCTLYVNAFFGYDPTNLHFQQATEYFWDHYSMEEDSWRDQPLWCHTMEHFHMKPLLMGEMFRPRRGQKKHQYGDSQDNDAAASASAATANTS